MFAIYQGQSSAQLAAACINSFIIVDSSNGYIACITNSGLMYLKGYVSANGYP
jgi:hypothetical protein